MHFQLRKIVYGNVQTNDNVISRLSSGYSQLTTGNEREECFK